MISFCLVSFNCGQILSWCKRTNTQGIRLCSGNWARTKWSFLWEIQIWGCSWSNSVRIHPCTITLNKLLEGLFKLLPKIWNLNLKRKRKLCQKQNPPDNNQQQQWDKIHKNLNKGVTLHLTLMRLQQVHLSQWTHYKIWTQWGTH